MNTTRSRWAAIGAAVAVTLGAGGIGITHATTDSGDGPVSAFFPIEPCRLADTRPAPDTVGSRTTGIGPGETYDLDGWGTVGDCTLPSDITGLSVNVTAVGASDQTNLRFFPQGATLPTAANLNPTPGAPPTPNAVNVALNETNGQFSVFNAFGTVAVIIDVVGYYDNHTHDDRYAPAVAAPVAFGVVGAVGGGTISGYNIDSSSYDGTGEFYVISSDSVEFGLNTPVVVTPLNILAPCATATVTTRTQDGDLRVYVSDLAGDPTLCSFSFVVYEAPTT